MKGLFPQSVIDVFIGTGARVLGGIDIGDGARFGVNAVAIEAVAAVITAIGVQARVVGIYKPGSPEASWDKNQLEAQLLL